MPIKSKLVVMISNYGMPIAICGDCKKVIYYHDDYQHTEHPTLESGKAIFWHTSCYIHNRSDHPKDKE